jgi:hypothetical protein
MKNSTIRKALSLGVIATWAFTIGCSSMTPQQTRRPAAQAAAPCIAVQQPILGHPGLIVMLTYNYAYTAKEPIPAWHKGDIVSRLNEMGSPDGNHFAEANGQAVNFYFTYTLNNDGNDHFTGTVVLSGWGVSHIETIYIGQPYASSSALTRDLTDRAYHRIRSGWTDSRPSCPQY